MFYTFYIFKNIKRSLNILKQNNLLSDKCCSYILFLLQTLLPKVTYIFDKVGVDRDSSLFHKLFR